MLLDHLIIKHVVVCGQQQGVIAGNALWREGHTTQVKVQLLDAIVGRAKPVNMAALNWGGGAECLACLGWSDRVTVNTNSVRGPSPHSCRAPGSREGIQGNGRIMSPAPASRVSFFTVQMHSNSARVSY